MAFLNDLSSKIGDVDPHRRDMPRRRPGEHVKTASRSLLCDGQSGAKGESVRAKGLIQVGIAFINAHEPLLHSLEPLIKRRIDPRNIGTKSG